MLLKHASTEVPLVNLCVAPDCGLKTQNWDEVIPILRNMLGAAKINRTRFNQLDA